MPKWNSLKESRGEFEVSDSFNPSITIDVSDAPFLEDMELGKEFQILFKAKKTGMFKDNNKIEVRLEITGVYETKEEKTYV